MFTHSATVGRVDIKYIICLHTRVIYSILYVYTLSGVGSNTVGWGGVVLVVVVE